VAVFVESNFLLELAFRQQEYAACARIWQGAEAGRYALHLPHYCLAEVFETLRRRRGQRDEYETYLRAEIIQHRREENTDSEAMDTLASGLNTLLVERTRTQSQRLFELGSAVAELATVVPLAGAVIQEAQQKSQQHGLSEQDSLVYASVLTGLRALPADTPKLFVSRNEVDFKKPAVLAELRALNCEYLASFRAEAGRLRV
jgi:predicted nucleic acid-binding protein